MSAEMPGVTVRLRGWGPWMVSAVAVLLLLLASLAAAASSEVTLRVEGMTCGA